MIKDLKKGTIYVSKHIKKDYENSNGKRTSIIKHIIENDQISFLWDKKIISVPVYSITYDEENEIFLMKDKLDIENELSCYLYFYVDYYERTLGVSWTNLSSRFYPMKEFIGKQEYLEYKRYIADLIRNLLHRRMIEHDDKIKEKIYEKKNNQPN